MVHLRITIYYWKKFKVQISKIRFRHSLGIHDAKNIVKNGRQRIKIEWGRGEMVFEIQNCQKFEIRNSGDDTTCGHATRAQFQICECLASSIVEKNGFQNLTDILLCAAKSGRDRNYENDCNEIVEGRNKRISEFYCSETFRFCLASAFAILSFILGWLSVYRPLSISVLQQGIKASRSRRHAMLRLKLPWTSPFSLAGMLIQWCFVFHVSHWRSSRLSCNPLNRSTVIISN
jgi:hypothetical protein